MVVVIFSDWEDESDFAMEASTAFDDDRSGSESRPAISDDFHSLCTHLQQSLRHAIGAAVPAKGVESTRLSPSESSRLLIASSTQRQ